MARHVEATQAREERIERVVAVIGSALVVLVFAVTTGLGLIEGVLAYAGAGALVFYGLWFLRKLKDVGST